MSRWFRHYAGMMRDEKLVRAAIKSGQSIERVVWLWGAILESAAEVNDGGRFDLDIAEAAYFLRTDQSDLDAVLAALEEGGRIDSGRVVRWSDRQFQSDSSTTRTRRHRDKQKQASDGDGQSDETDIHRHTGVTERSGNDDETSLGASVTAGERSQEAVQRSGNAPETETEADTETKAAQHTEPREAKAETPPPLPGIPIALWQGGRTREWFEQLEAECREAAGLETNPSPSLCDLSPIVGLLDAGYDFARDILPQLRKAKAKGVAPATWSYFVPGIEQASAKVKAIAPKPESVPAEQKTIWLTEDDPRWPAVSDAVRARTGKPPWVTDSRQQYGRGAYVPADLVTPA